MSDLSVRSESVSYATGGRTLVADVTLGVESGEFVGLIGPNGAGKSTLLRLLGGDLRPSSGHVEVLGGPVFDVPPRELALRRAMLGANPPSEVAFSTRTVIEAGRYPHRGLVGNTDAIDAEAVRAAMAVTAVDEALWSRPFYTLSSGEQARAHVARVLAQDSPVLMFDEPTASLDMANAEMVLATLQSEARSGHTVLCVIHDLNAAAHFCDRVLLMTEGRVVADGSPRQVMTGDLLTAAYGHEMEVVDHPFRDCPLVLVV